MLRSKIKFEKFKKVLISLEAIYLKQVQDDRSNVDATIRRFEFTFELLGAFLKDYFSERDIELNYPKEVLQKAFSVNLINNEDIWVRMLKDRNLTSHTYDERLADEIYNRIRSYVPELRGLLNKIMDESSH